MRIALIAKPGHENTGVGRYTLQLRAALEAQGHEVVVAHPVVPLPGMLVRLVQKLLGWDLSAFFNNYPVWARYPQADIFHVTSQNLASLILLKSPPGPTVVTVHDVIPWLVRSDSALRIYKHRVEELFDRLAMAGLRHADGLLVDSVFSQSSLLEPDTIMAKPKIDRMRRESWSEQPTEHT